MYKCISQSYVEEYLDNNIDLSCFNLDFNNFNPDKDIYMYDYQVETLSNTCKLLLHYFNSDRQNLIEFYKSSLSDEQLEEINSKLDFSEDDMIIQDLNLDDKVSFLEFINRASYWMATGSGKTLIIVKIIELLFDLMKLEEIPTKKILVVAPSKYLIKQLKNHIDEFNNYKGRDLKIHIKHLKKYESSESSYVNVATSNSITIYFTLSNHLSNTNKEMLMDYRDFIEKEGWYVILDEAHKGDTDSKRKQYLNILSRNGFMFNFSATFTEPLDIITTIMDFKLDEFIKAGYGKNIKVLDDEFKDFKSKNRKESDFENIDKEKIIIKSFLVYTAIKKSKDKIINISNNKDLKLEYHNPLMLTISNEINTKNADMKLYFKCISELSKGISENIIDELKDELIKKITDNRAYSVGEECITDHICDSIKYIKYKDILKYVFNSDYPGEIEVTEVGGNNDELAFKLKTSTVSTPFALLKASNVINWKFDILQDYIFTESATVDKGGYFNSIHQKYNEINILMGSKQFIEGWDSNRPNVISFINMGISDERTKLVLQTIGRGVRVEPYKSNKRRLKLSPRYIEYGHKTIKDIEPHSNLLESLFIFATNKEVIKNILSNLEKDKWNTVKGISKTSIKKDLYLPVYETLEKNNNSYKISETDYEIINSYLKSNSEKLLLVRDDLTLSNINRIKNKDNLSVRNDLQPKEIHPIQMINYVENHFNQKKKVLKGFIKDERISIIHYKDIKVNLNNTSKEELIQLEKGILSILEKVNKKYTLEQKQVIQMAKALGEEDVKLNDMIMNLLKTHSIGIDEIFNDKEEMNLLNNYNIKLKNIAQHYYNPIIISENNQNYQHIIKNSSEIEFLENLERFISNNSVDVDWWYFSKIDESKDDIYIPYYDNNTQKYRKFYPDFIFWIKKDDTYSIKFVDPKGLVIEQNPRDKINGFKDTFKEKNYSNGEDDNIFVELWYYSGRIVEDRIINEHKIYNDSLCKIFNINNMALNI